MPERNKQEERLIHLEETVFFQEQLLQELSAALSVQQRQLDQVEQELARARNRIQELHRMLDNSGGTDAGPPPHYATRE